MRLHSLCAVLVLAALLTGSAFAQEQVTQFQGADNEAMRFRHLWIAYGAIWALVMVFIWRTWSRQQATAAELADLKRRLATMEGGADGGD